MIADVKSILEKPQISNQRINLMMMGTDVGFIFGLWFLDKLINFMTKAKVCYYVKDFRNNKVLKRT